MTHSEYIAYGRNLATRHKEVLHVEGHAKESHFARIILQKDEFGVSNIEEFLNAERNRMRFPFVLWEAYDHNYRDNRSDNIQKVYQGAFIILINPTDLKAQAGGNSFTAEELAIDKAEKIGEDFLSYMKKDFAENLSIRFLELNDASGEKIGPVLNNLIGMRFSFSFQKTANRQLHFNPENWLS